MTVGCGAPGGPCGPAAPLGRGPSQQSVKLDWPSDASFIIRRGFFEEFNWSQYQYWERDMLDWTPAVALPAWQMTTQFQIPANEIWAIGLVRFRLELRLAGNVAFDMNPFAIGSANFRFAFRIDNQVPIDIGIIGATTTPDGWRCFEDVFNQRIRMVIFVRPQAFVQTAVWCNIVDPYLGVNSASAMHWNFRGVKMTVDQFNQLQAQMR